MTHAMKLSADDSELLIELLCCVIAADKKVSAREVRFVSDLLSSLGLQTQRDVLQSRIVTYCKAIHGQGAKAYAEALSERLAPYSGTAVASIFHRVQPELANSDGQVSPAEQQIAARLIAALSLSGTPSVQQKPERTITRSSQDKATNPSSFSQAGQSAKESGTAAWKVAAAVMCVFPYGVYLLWNHPTLGRSKWWWRFALAWPVIVGILGAMGSPPQQKSGGARASRVESLKSKIHAGMTQQQVLAAIGRPLKKTRVKNPVPGLQDEDWSYEKDKFAVFFKDGIVLWTIPE